MLIVCAEIIILYDLNNINVQECFSVMYEILGCFHIFLFSLVSSAVIGEVDEDIDKQLDFHELRAEPLNPVVH